MARLIRRIRDWLIARKTRSETMQALRGMDDAVLADLGLMRDQIGAYAAESANEGNDNLAIAPEAASDQKPGAGQVWKSCRRAAT